MEPSELFRTICAACAGPATCPSVAYVAVLLTQQAQLAQLIESEPLYLRFRKHKV